MAVQRGTIAVQAGAVNQTGVEAGEGGGGTIGCGLCDLGGGGGVGGRGVSAAAAAAVAFCCNSSSRLALFRGGS